MPKGTWGSDEDADIRREQIFDPMVSNLEIRNLSFGYGKKFSLSIPHLTANQGVTCLLGPNGAGKSTLFRLLTTSTMPPSHSVFLDGRDIRTCLKEFRHALGFLPQRVGLVNNYRVSEMLEYIAWMKGIPRNERRRAVAEAADKCDVTRFLQHQVGTLSGGTLRRVGIAQAIINSPRVLILDEPTAGLDMIQQSQLHLLVKTISSSAVVVVSTHSSADVSEMGNDVTVMNAGRILFTGSVAELASSNGSSLREGVEMGYRRMLDDQFHESS